MSNPKESWSISIQKDYLKFSAAHFLIFPDGSAERLHGHNYKVYVDLQTDLDEHGLVLNFKEIKPLIRELCDELDERVLMPGEHPALTCIEIGDGELEVRYRTRRYVLPQDEVIVLPISNTSAENLATWVGRQLRRRLVQRWGHVRVRSLSVSIEETPGQRGVFTMTDGLAQPDDDCSSR